MNWVIQIRIQWFPDTLLFKTEIFSNIWLAFNVAGKAQRIVQVPGRPQYRRLTNCLKKFSSQLVYMGQSFGPLE